MDERQRVIELAREHFSHSPVASGIITDETRLEALGKGDPFAVGMFPEVLEDAFGVEFTHAQYERLCRRCATIGEVCKLVERLSSKGEPAEEEQAAA